LLRERARERSAGWRDCFTVNVCTDNRNIPQQQSDGRRRNRKNSVFGLDCAARPGQRAAMNCSNVQVGESNQRANDVNNRVYRTDFVKVNSIDRHAVHLALSFSQ
jgi:hypothetical protein